MVNLCMQRSGKRGSGCNAPNEADRFFKSSEGLPTPETSPLRPPKPPRTEVSQYSWHNSIRKEVCMHIRTLEPLKTRKNKGKVKSRHLESTNYDVIIASPNSDVILRNVRPQQTHCRNSRGTEETIASHLSRIRPIEGLLRVCNMNLYQNYVIISNSNKCFWLFI